MQYNLTYYMDNVVLISRNPSLVSRNFLILPELHIIGIDIFFWVGYYPCAKQDVQQSIKNNILCFALTLNKVMLEWWWSNVAVFSNNASKDTNIHCIIITMSCHFLSLSLCIISAWVCFIVFNFPVLNVIFDVWKW